MDSIDTSKLTDRELLLLLHERQGNMGKTIDKLNDTTTKDLATLTVEIGHLRESKADKTEVEQLKRGQNRLFNYLWFAFGAIAILQIALTVYLSVRSHN